MAELIKAYIIYTHNTYTLQMTFSDRHVLQSPQQNLVKKKFDIKKKITQNNGGSVTHNRKIYNLGKKMVATRLLKTAAWQIYKPSSKDNKCEQVILLHIQMIWM